MTTLWPERSTCVPLGEGPGSAFARHLPALVPDDVPPVILLHGFRATAADWGPLAERLAATRDVWAPDLITHPGPGPRGMHAVHDLLERTRVAAGDGPVDVIASSMGGFIAASWASSSPDSVSGLTLLAPALVNLHRLWRMPGLTRLLGRKRFLDVDERRWELALTSATSATALRRDTPHHLSLPEELRQALLDHGRTASRDEAASGRTHARQEVLIELMAALRRPRGISTMLSGIRVPVLWLHGTDDPLVPIGRSRDVATRMRNCSFVPLERVGHLPHLECPDEVAQQFLSRFGAQPSSHRQT